MAPFSGRKRVYSLIALAGILILLSADYLGLFEGVNTYIYDLSFRVRGPNRPPEKVIIAAIDEKTLEKAGRWPIRRYHYATLLDRLSGARVVVFDLILSEASEDDAVLAEAIKRHGRVILPVYLDRGMKIVPPARPLSPYRTGHLHIEHGVDNVARQIFHTLYADDKKIPSLTSAAYEVMTGRQFGRQPLGQGLPKGMSQGSIYQKDRMNINYYGNPGTFTQVPLIDIIDGRYPQSFFFGKAVLVGITAPGIVDMISTPFSHNRDRMSGVEVQANILGNLLDNNPLRAADDRVVRTAAVGLSVLFFILFMSLGEKKAAALWVLSLILIMASSLLLFSRFGLWIKPALYLSSVSFIFFATYILRLDEAARNLDAKYISVSSLLGGGMESAQGLAEPGGLRGLISAGGIDTRIQNLLRVENMYEKKLESTVQEKTLQLSEALQTISKMSSEMIYRLTAAAESRDEYTGIHTSRIGLYANRLSEELSMPPEFIERITLASTMHDIGKIGIPDRILLKPGGLSPEEIELIKTHTTIGWKILSGSEFPMIQMSATIALHHHERWDGTGYPKGLSGEDIPIEARILMICDIYDALRSRRPYKESLDHKAALKVITEGDFKTRPGHFDPGVLSAFIRVAADFDEIFTRFRD